MLQSAASADGMSRFELAPPRRFILPAILLLLSEHPGYGYRLTACLRDLRFGHVDRPAVYRALAQLEADGLVEGVADHEGARQARRVYHVTGLGERVLRVWMGVIKEEHERLEHVLRRYQATGTGDAVLAEVEGGWAAALGYGWSSVSSTSDGLRRLTDVSAEPATAADRAPSLSPGRFRLAPDRSVVLIEVRSTAGPLSFGSVGLTGSIEATLTDGVVQARPPPTARIEIDVAGLRSGNRLYDAELLRRIDARHFPTAAVALHACAPAGAGGRYLLDGELTFHGVTRPAHGTVHVEAVSDHRLVITGEQSFDIRDFAIPSPTVLMLRIYPDVRVRLHVEAELCELSKMSEVEVQ
jgi:DNA-binding PadR family transcriptional regulator